MEEKEQLRAVKEEHSRTPMAGLRRSTAMVTCTTGTVALGGRSGPLLPAPLARGIGRRGGRGDFLVLPIFVAPGSRVLTPRWSGIHCSSSPCPSGACGKQVLQAFAAALEAWLPALGTTTLVVSRPTSTEVRSSGKVSGCQWVLCPLHL